MEDTYLNSEVVIVGSGPAGLTCSIYAARSGLAPVLLIGNVPGGQLITTDVIENYPGFKSISGCDLMMNMLSQAEELGTQFIYQSLEQIEQTDDNLFILSLSSGERITTKAVVIATGATHRRLGVPGESEFSNKGVSWCATCDGPMYREKRVAVVGGGNTAVMEAMFLSNFAEQVYLIHRRDSLRAEKYLQNKLLSNNRIEFLWNSEIVRISGDKVMDSVLLRNIVKDSESPLKLDGLFIAIGTTPSSGFCRDLIETDDDGYIMAIDTKTSCTGIFAAGDIVSGSLKQAIFAAGQGALVARYVEEYLGAR
ncbi:MAG: thioredoxin-disulfide reductase [Holosporales bacterium]|jgi:thioredoxin reductase (NADPH)|nr:thioredoxin-disulfide reductase [Holosporales bacterium]